MFFESLFVSLPWNYIRHQDDRKGMEGFLLVSSVTAGAGFAAVRLCRNDRSKWTLEHGIIWLKNKNIFVGISNEFYIYFSKKHNGFKEKPKYAAKKEGGEKSVDKGEESWYNSGARLIERGQAEAAEADKACEVPWKPFSDRKNLTK